MAWTARALAALVLGIAGIAGPAAAAAPLAAAPPSLDAQLDDARSRLDALTKQIDAKDIADERLVALRDQALALQVRADAIANQIEPLVADVTARVAELGPAPAAPATESSDVAAQRASLGKQSAALDAQLKLARLLSVEAQQAADRTIAARRSQFEAQLGERAPSILASRFWHEFGASWPRDIASIRALFTDLAAAARSTPPAVWAGFIVLAVAVLALQRWLMRVLIRTAHVRLTDTRLRRALFALGFTLLSALGPAAAAQAIAVALTFAVQPSQAVQSLLVTLVGSVAFGAYLTGLASALIAPGRPDWRLSRISDAVANAVGRYPLWLAIVVALSWLGDRLATLANATLATTVAFNCITALVICGVLALFLRSADRASRAAHRADASLIDPQHALRSSILLHGGRVLLIVSIACLLLGYVAFGSFVLKQIVWIGVVVATTWMLTVVVDEVLDAWFTPHPADGSSTPVVGLQSQAAVLASGVLRLTLVLLALVMIGAPFGQGPGELIQRGQQLRDGISVGEIAIKPGALIEAMLVLAAGLAGVRMLQAWLAHDYLPTTRLDAGMRMSTSTLLGFIGMILVVAFALSALGIGLERIAWVASALSVGIGFGLQAIVQNFVAGLILLAERPVRVGDWVSLSGVEGDIRAINVRATEIELGDRSTVIMPNSEFITKAVRNITRGEAMGLVQLRLPLPLSVDVEKVRQILFDAFHANDSILQDPAPVVFIDGLLEAVQKIVFNASASVTSPRDAYPVRSAVLFDVMKRLREAGITL